LALLAQKGGAGKTTLALHLAVIAHDAGVRTLVLDCDPQKSAMGWAHARGGAAPAVMAMVPANLRAAVAKAAGEGFGLVIVDTRPSVERDTAEVARVADFSLIPSRPSILDLRAIGATVDVLKALSRPAAIVLNACPAGRGDTDATVTAEARNGLASYGLPLAPVAIGVRAAMSHALIDGRAVTEFEPRGKASAELRRLWEWTEEHLWPNGRA
jgi:chromosome partitioning protein